MSEVQPSSPLGGESSPSEVAWRQGDVFSLREVFILADGGHSCHSVPHGVVLISQTCDVVLPDRVNVQVAPIVQLEGDVAREARDGKRSRYVRLPQMGDGHFADLDIVCTVNKGSLKSLWVGSGVCGDVEDRRFAGAVARRFGRFAFPDCVSDAMKVLRDVIQSKSKKPESPFGRILEDVLELRAESGDWTQATPDVTLIFALRPGVLPALSDEDFAAVSESYSRYDEILPSSAKAVLTQIANDLCRGGPTDPVEVHCLWQRLADAAAISCEYQAQRISDGVHPTFVGDVISADEFPLTRVRNSEVVDLDHLSVPVPL